MAMYYLAMQDDKNNLAYEKKKIEIRPFKQTSFNMVVYRTPTMEKDVVEENIKFLMSLKEKDPDNDIYEKNVATIKMMWGESNPKGNLTV